MKKTITFCLLVGLVANLTLAVQAASRRGPIYTATVALPQEAGLSAEQMDNLLAPIALYPDPLLAQVFPASTFVDQIDAAARWLRSHNNNGSGVDNQSWDVSVKSIAHYPQVVYMMSDKLDWTTALGQAYVNQSTDVLTSVQRLRARARAAGYLDTTSQQSVIVEGQVIKIVPAQPQVIYVPTYNPEVVYVQTGPSTGTVIAATAISFGVGLAIGAWLNNDCNWYSHTVFYHGWHGVGWISTSSRYVHVNGIYVNNRYARVNVNRAVINRNVNYNNIGRYNNVSRNINYNNITRSNVSRSNVSRNNVNRSSVNRRRVNNSPTNRRSGAVTRRNSTSVGSGNTRATRAQSQRAQGTRAASRQPSTSRFGGGKRSGGGARVNRSSGGRSRGGGRRR